MTDPVNVSTELSIGDTPVRLRNDLHVVTIRRGLQITHVVKDPVNLKYYEFDEHEMALIQQFDGSKSWDEICEWFNHRFPPLRLTHQALQSTLWRLYQQGLLIAFAKGQGLRVAERLQERKQQEWWQRLSQPWVIRLPGFSPGPWIGLVNSLFGWIFAPAFVSLALVGLSLLIACIFAQHQAIIRMSPDSIAFFSRNNMASFAVVVIVTKMLHELGHAVAAYRRGCECHEMGILLLAGLPSLYCDVSDAWMIPSRWKRITISLAGIWVETLIAAVAFIVWTASVPGLIHAMSFNVMVVCSVGTLLFNANPLVRYDGYYVLMDLSGVSNLGQRSQESLVRCFAYWVLGSPGIRPLDEPEIPRWCLVYGVASAIYRVLLTAAIVWGLHLALKPFSISIFVWVFASVGLTMWSARMFQSGSNQVRNAMSTGTPLWRVCLGLAFLVGTSTFVTTIPLPWYVFGEAILEPADQKTLVMTVPGRVVFRRDSGDIVKAGDLIGKFENQEIHREVRLMEAEVRIQSQRLQALRARRNQDVRAAEQIPGAEASMAALKHRLKYLHEELQRLELHADESAVVYHAPLRLQTTDSEELTGWTGSLLNPVNNEAWIEAGDPFCQIGSINTLEAVAVLAQDDLDAISLGQPVDILLKSSGISVRGEVAKISSIEFDAQDESTLGAALPRIADRQGRGRLHEKWYQIQVRSLNPFPQGTRIRSRAKVRIHAGSRTLAAWIAEQFYKTFRWHA